MLSLRTSGIEWSLGSKPHWELDKDDEEIDGDEFRSVAESLVVLQSLRQSRDKWLNATFPKFSSKSRGGKPAEVVPPPHTIHNRGRCDIEIGPHIFPDTVIFEVHYQYLQPSVSKPMYLYQPPGPAQTNSWQATTPYGTAPYAPYGHRPLDPPSVSPVATVPASTETAASQKSPAPLLSSLGSSVSITPTLISQVNAAASSNPTLANLLQLAASGKATPEQLKTLGLLIQSLVGSASSDGTPNPSGTASAAGTPQPDSSKASTPAPAQPFQSPTCISASKATTLHPAFAPSKEFDLVLEFAENPSDRWILPRAPVVVECITGVGTADDILLTAGLPFAKAPLPGAERDKTEATTDDSSQELVTFCFTRASSDIWNCVSRWAGAQEKMDITRKAFERLLGQESDRVYLAHQLPDGALLSQIQNSAALPYALKSIRPTQADTMKPKRVRKPAAPKPATTKPATDMPSFSVVPQVPKKKKQGKSVPTLPKIACVACGQSDVPLIMGGRYCRPCAGSESQTYPGSSQNGAFIHKFWAGPNQPQFTPQPIFDPQSVINPPSPSVEQLPAVPAAPKRNKSSAKMTPHPPDSSTEPPHSSKKKKLK